MAKAARQFGQVDPADDAASSATKVDFVRFAGGQIDCFLSNANEPIGANLHQQTHTYPAGAYPVH